MVCKKSRME